MAIAAIAAIQVLKAGTVWGPNWDIGHRIKEDQKAFAQYFAGCASALKYSSADPAKEFSGSFGHGYSFIVHSALKELKIQSWYVRGHAKSPSQVLTQKAWGVDLSPELRRLEALLRRASRALDLKSVAHTWMRSSESLSGNGIKKTLPWSKVGILTLAEQEFLSYEFKQAADNFYRLKADIDHPDLVLMQNFPNRVKEVSQSLRLPALMVDRLIAGRFQALNRGLSRKELKHQSKLPIEVRIGELDMETRMEVFHPLFLKNRRFRVTQELVKAVDTGDPDARKELLHQATIFCQAEENKRLQRLALSWFNTELSE
jgi:hypothetical protein